MHFLISYEPILSSWLTDIDLVIGVSFLFRNWIKIEPKARYKSVC